ncbi:MAG: DNA/RNA nuclease SfsA [Clostridia bacterium]|nr:DNA/RNA nuclease SfsA [Clostridia bacterium]
MNENGFFDHIKKEGIYLEVPGTPKTAIFKKRLNRFVAEVMIGGVLHLSHVPSSGRMSELLYPGAEVYVLPMSSEKRKTPFKLIAAKHKGQLVSVDSLLPNRLIDKALKKKAMGLFKDYGRHQRECTYKNSRFDFCFLENEIKCLIEVKSVTLVEDGAALFPDAPSSRAKKHLKELMHAKRNGFDAHVVFVIQRSDALFFRPNDSRDPGFGALLRQSSKAGVALSAYDCRVDRKAVKLNGSLPIVL